MATVPFLTRLCVLLSFGVFAQKEEVVVIVADPYWDDVAFYAYQFPLLHNYKVVKVMTRLGRSFTFETAHAELYKTFTYGSETADPDKAAAEICPKLKGLGFPVAGVVPSSDPTGALADQLAACLGVRGNAATGPLAEARRNKWVMGETVRKAGLRSVRQAKVSTWDAAETYLKSWEPPLSPSSPCVFKVLTGAGSEGVMKATNLQEAKEIFDQLLGASSSLGGQYVEVLIQEFLQGKQYAVDSVSRDGVHKVVTVWYEDFRPANGAFNDYFGFKVLDPEDAFSKVLIDYSNKVLDATGVVNGAANLEVMFLESEQAPCLMEVNARWAGLGWSDGYAVEQETAGNTQIAATFDAFLDKEAFDRMPTVAPLKRNGAIVFGVSYETGILKGMPGLVAAKKYPSYFDASVRVAENTILQKTTTGDSPIIVALIHKDKAVVDADYDRMIELENAKAFFEVAPLVESVLRAADSVGWMTPSVFASGFVGLILGSVGTLLATFVRSQQAATGDGTEYLAIA